MECGHALRAALGEAPGRLSRVTSAAGRCHVVGYVLGPILLFCFLFINMIMRTFSDRENMHCDTKLEIIC